MADVSVRNPDGSVNRETARRVIREALERRVDLPLAIELAGKWKHNWIPLDPTAVAVKAKKYKGGGEDKKAESVAKKAKIRIRPGVYSGETGHHISGKDTKGRGVAVFVPGDRADADKAASNIHAGRGAFESGPVGRAVPKGRYDKAGHLADTSARGSVRSKGSVGRKVKERSPFQGLVDSGKVQPQADRMSHKESVARANAGDSPEHRFARAMADAKTGPGSGHIDTKAVARGHVGASDPAALAAKLPQAKLEHIAQSNTMEGRAAKAELARREDVARQEHSDWVHAQDKKNTANANTPNTPRARYEATSTGRPKADPGPAALPADRVTPDGFHVAHRAETDGHGNVTGHTVSVVPGGKPGNAAGVSAEQLSGAAGVRYQRSTVENQTAAEDKALASARAKSLTPKQGAEKQIESLRKALGGSAVPKTGDPSKSGSAIASSQVIARAEQMYGSDRTRWSGANLRATAKLGDPKSKAELARRGK